MAKIWDGPTPHDSSDPKYDAFAQFTGQEAYRSAMNSPEVRAMYESMAALRQHIKSLRLVPPLKIGEHPPWHLLEKTRELNVEVDKALAAYEAGLKEEEYHANTNSSPRTCL